MLAVLAKGPVGHNSAQRCGQVHQALKKHGGITVPREFVFMDRAAVGLGAVFLHLRAELNFGAMFAASVEGFSTEALAARQAAALVRPPSPPAAVALPSAVA